MIPEFRTGISAAQNGPVTRICQNCRALLLTTTENCSFCHPPAETPAARRNSRQIEFEDSGKDLWRKEVTRRLSDYRARRGQTGHEGEDRMPHPSRPQVAAEPVARVRFSQAISAEASDRLEICVQPELDFSSSHDDRVHPQTALVPVASLSRRRWAGTLDAGFIMLTLASFLTLFHGLGGDIVIGRLDALVGAIVVFLFYSMYFVLFTILNSATPGMQLCGLNTVRLDGALPDTRQLVWRSFGYLLSGITLAFGYLWSVWDEDHFTWHDRISHTYISSVAPLN
jgi:uncharacterized RDD family membrane protein YckC